MRRQQGISPTIHHKFIIYRDRRGYHWPCRYRSGLLVQLVRLRVVDQINAAVDIIVRKPAKKMQSIDPIGASNVFQAAQGPTFLLIRNALNPIADEKGPHKKVPSYCLGRCGLGLAYVWYT